MAERKRMILRAPMVPKESEMLEEMVKMIIAVITATITNNTAKFSL